MSAGGPGVAGAGGGRGAPTGYSCSCRFNTSGSVYYVLVSLTDGLPVQTPENGSSCPGGVASVGASYLSTAPTVLAPGGVYECGCPADGGRGQGSSSILFGVLISFVGAVLMSLGQVVMKWAHTHNELRSLAERRHYVKNPWWWAGLLIYAVSQILTVVSFISVSQAENAVIGTFSLVANAIFAKQMLGEEMTRLHWAGMAAIATGAVMTLVALTGVTCFDTPSATDEIIRALSPSGNPPFFIFMMLIGSVLLAGLCVRRVGQWSARKGGAPCRRFCKDLQIRRWGKGFGSGRQRGTGGGEATPSEAGSLASDASAAGLQRPLLTSSSASASGAHDGGRQRVWTGESSSSSFVAGPRGVPLAGGDPLSERAFLFVVIAACCGCSSGFSANATVKVVTNHIADFGTSIAPWLLLTTFVVAIFMAMHYLNRGLQSGQALLVVPSYFVLNTFLAMVCSVLYQKTYLYLSYLQCGVFILGGILALLGVVAMMWREMRDDSDRFKEWLQRVAAALPDRRSGGVRRGGAGGKMTTTTTAAGDDFSTFAPRIGPRDGSKAQSAPPVEKYVQISPTLSPIAVGPDAVDALSNNSFLHGSASASAPAAAPAGEPADV